MLLEGGGSEHSNKWHYMLTHGSDGIKLQRSSEFCNKRHLNIDCNIGCSFVGSSPSPWCRLRTQSRCCRNVFCFSCNCFQHISSNIMASKVFKLHHIFILFVYLRRCSCRKSPCSVTCLKTKLKRLYAFTKDVHSSCRHWSMHERNIYKRFVNSVNFTILKRQWNALHNKEKTHFITILHSF